MNNARTVNMVIGGLILIVCLCVTEAGILAVRHAESAVIVGITGIGLCCAGGLVGLLANTNSADKQGVVTTSQDVTSHTLSRSPALVDAEGKG